MPPNHKPPPDNDLGPDATDDTAHLQRAEQAIDAADLPAGLRDALTEVIEKWNEANAGASQDGHPGNG